MQSAHLSAEYRLRDRFVAALRCARVRITANGTRVEIAIPVGADHLDSALRSGNLLNLLQ
jgi:hypothetical protein